MLQQTSKESAGAQHVFDGKPLQAGESVTLGAGPVDVEVFERAAVLQQLVVRLTLSQGRLGQLGYPGGLQRFLHLRVGPERPCLLP